MVGLQRVCSPRRSCSFQQRILLCSWKRDELSRYLPYYKLFEGPCGTDPRWIPLLNNRLIFFQVYPVCLNEKNAGHLRICESRGACSRNTCAQRAGRMEKEVGTVTAIVCARCKDNDALMAIPARLSLRPAPVENVTRPRDAEVVRRRRQASYIFVRFQFAYATFADAHTRYKGKESLGKRRGASWNAHHFCRVEFEDRKQLTFAAIYATMNGWHLNITQISSTSAVTAMLAACYCYDRHYIEFIRCTVTRSVRLQRWRPIFIAMRPAIMRKAPVPNSDELVWTSISPSKILLARIYVNMYYI